jgi:hypothetical protein
MYIDLVIFIILIVAVVFFFRRFSSFVYLVCAIDIFFRLLHFLADHMGVAELTSLINKYIPGSVAGMIGNYIGATGLIYTIILWIMFGLYCILLFYIIRILVKRK